MNVPNHYVAPQCLGEKCRCGKPATHKVEEVIFDNDPEPLRHELTVYVCCEHFAWLMGPAAPCYRVKLEDGR